VPKLRQRFRRMFGCMVQTRPPPGKLLVTVVFTGSSLAWGASMPWVGAQSQPTIESFSTNRRLIRPQMTCARAPGIFPSIAYWNANRRSSCHKRNAKWKSPIHLVPRTPRFTPNPRELEGGGMPASAALLTIEVFVCRTSRCHIRLHVSRARSAESQKGVIPAVETTSGIRSPLSPKRSVLTTLKRYRDAETSNHEALMTICNTPLMRIALSLAATAEVQCRRP
jgi:hypothetical protein